MRCPQARTLISLYVGPEPSWLRTRECQALETHLAACEECRRDWQESREALGLLHKHWQISEDTKVLLKESRPPGRHGIRPRTLLLPTRRRVAVGAAAAGLVLAVLGAWAVFPQKASRTGADRPVAFREADPPFIVAWADGDRLTPGTSIGTASGETRCLVLNAKHQIVMRGDTRLSCAPLVENGRTGCRVHLAQGEIFARVEHDGNPFIVQTALGRAVIMGTTFDIKVGQDGATLAVVEGSVRFESAAGHVQVVAAQSSTITAASIAPSVPAWCDADALTAWVKPDESMAPTAWNTSPDDFALDGLFATLSSREVQTELDALDYRQWVEQRRDWFRQQFPWVFALQEALEEEGVQTDYPTLLRQSGELWQFAYPPRDAGRQVEPDTNGLLRAASCYARDEHWLERHGLLLAGVTEDPRPKGPEAFDRWAAALEAQVGTCAPDADSRVLADTVSACLYLINMRMLALLSLRHGSLDEGPQVRRETEGLLREQLRLLTVCFRLSCGADLPRTEIRLCDDWNQLRKLVADIRTIARLEKQRSGCEKVISQ